MNDLITVPAGGKRRFSHHVEAARNLELRQLRAFVALAEHGTITAASQALGLAQSTVSEAISALERELGTAVIAHQRGARVVSLTVAGQALLPRAREVLAAVEQSYVAVAKASVSARGFVNIIANESVSTYVLSPVLASMRPRWQNTRFSVSVAACPEVREGVSGGSFDVGLLLTPAPEKRATKAKARNGSRSRGGKIVAPQVPLVVFTTPAHPLLKSQGANPVRRHALEPFLIFVSDAAGEYRAILERFFHGDQLPGPRLESTGSVEGVKTGVFADPLALGVLPCYAVAKEMKAGRLVPIHLRPALPQMQILALLGASSDADLCTQELLEEIGRTCVEPTYE